MIHSEFLIIGQGISGSCLSHTLSKAGRSFIVIDNAKSNAASRVASGVINPVTGRRIVKTWMIDDLMPFALDFYTTWSGEMAVDGIAQTNFIDFFPTPQMLLAFRERMLEGSIYLSVPDHQDLYRSIFNYDFGFGQISPCYLINLRNLLSAWRKKLLDQEKLVEEDFQFSELRLEQKITYRDIIAEKIIFCDGISSANSPLFKNLPFAFNKGEALIIETENRDGLMNSAIFKKGLSLVPYAYNQYWVGSSYEWNFEDDRPTPLFREKTEKMLRSWLKNEFVVLDHQAAIRPATIERRPFAGIHPHQPLAAIFNGMGTKGCSLAPYFAQQLMHQLLEHDPVQADVNINRFTRVLN